MVHLEKYFVQCDPAVPSRDPLLAEQTAERTVVRPDSQNRQGGTGAQIFDPR